MIRKETLNNGIGLMFEQLPYLSTAAIGIWIRAGSVDESGRYDSGCAENGYYSGISHLIEHMLFKGTDKRSAKDIAGDIDRIGGSINAFTSKETTCYYVKTLTEHVNESADVLIDMLSNSVFDPVEIKKEKKVIYEEIKMIEDNPEDLGQELIDESVFAGTSLGNRIIGLPETVDAISRENILDFLSKFYTGSNIVISAVGNFDAEALRTQLEEGLGSIPAGKTVRKKDLIPHDPVFKSIEKDIEQSHINMGLRGYAMEDKDYYAYMLYNSILGSGMSSRLFQNVREDKCLAYSVYSAALSYVDDGFFLIYAGVGVGNEAEALKAINNEVEDIATNGILDEELFKAREQNKGHYLFAQENAGSRMFSLGKNKLLLGRYYTAEEIIKGIDSVTKDDIRSIAKRYSDPNDFSVVIVSPKEIRPEELGLHGNES